MKKTLVLAALLLSSLLILGITGCTRHNDIAEDMMSELKSKTTTVEYAIMTDFYRIHKNFEGYRVLLSKIMSRTSAPPENTPAFCEEVMFMVPNVKHTDNHDIKSRVLMYYPTILADCPTAVKSSAYSSSKKDVDMYESVS